MKPGVFTPVFMLWKAVLMASWPLSAIMLHDLVLHLFEFPLLTDIVVTALPVRAYKPLQTWPTNQWCFRYGSGCLCVAHVFGFMLIIPEAGGCTSHCKTKRLLISLAPGWESQGWGGTEAWSVVSSVRAHLNKYLVSAEGGSTEGGGLLWFRGMVQCQACCSEGGLKRVGRAGI